MLNLSTLKIRPSSLMPPKAAGGADNFQTLEPACSYLLPFIKKFRRIWEPACGEGRMVRYFGAHGFNVTGTDILTGSDFLLPLTSALHDFDLIATNPPYSIKDAWLQRCFDIGKPFALLLPITALGEQERVSMYRKWDIQLIMPPERCQFVTPSGKQGGCWFYAAWFCHGLDLPQQITFLGR